MKRTRLERHTPLARTSSLQPGRVPPAKRAADTPPARRAGARPRGERLAGTKPAGNPIPRKVRVAVRERSAGRCELRATSDCTGVATDQHHRKRRRDGGHGLANVVDACRPCHTHAHAHPRQARDMGWIVSAFEVDPAMVPIRRIGGPGEQLTYLHDDGSKTTAHIGGTAR